MFLKLLNKFIPSIKVSDPLLSYREQGRYKPLAIRQLQLSPFIAKTLLKIRKYQAIEFKDSGKLTLIIPYRNRPHQLENNLPKIKDFLKSQGICHQILIVEQTEDKPFNRGKLLNVGAQLSWDDSDYFCFHDIDLIPQKANYQQPSQAIRLITRLSTTHRNSHILHEICFGGVTSINKQQFSQANGFSNNYWGWGKEDDDFLFRLLLVGQTPYEDSEGEYEDQPNPEQQNQAGKVANKKGSNRQLRSLLYRGQIDPQQEGFNTLNFEVLADESNDLYRKVTVKL